MNKLLELLQENARLSCEQLAVMLGEHPGGSPETDR